MSPGFLQECFHYDSASGKLIWRLRPRNHFKNGAGWVNFNRNFAGKIAGTTKNNGVVEIKLNGATYKASRVIWAMQTGEVNFGIIDHIDGNPSNNRFENLRKVSAQQNAQNRNNKSKNSSGITGVTWHKPSKKWWVRVTVNGKTHSLGLYDDITDAANVILSCKREWFGEFARA